MGFDEGRGETIRYHEELYSAPEAHDPDAWLNRPAPIVMDALAHLDRTRPVRVYDLGAGSGRHTIPLARALPAGSRSTCSTSRSSSSRSAPPTSRWATW